MSAALRLERLRVWYATEGPPIRAVDDVSLAVAPREVVGLVGESGCGKSTVGRAAIGLLPNHTGVAGRVLVGECDMGAAPEAERRQLRGRTVALVLEDPMTRLNPLTSVGRQLDETLAQHETGLARVERRRRCVGVLEALGLGERWLTRYPHELSGGMRQRVMVAMALILRPALVIADEPTTALDPVTRERVLATLRGLASRGGACLLISHDLRSIGRWCDRVAVMYAGRVVEQGVAAEVLDDPAHPYTRALLRSSISPATRALHPIPGAPPDLADPGTGCRFRPRCEHAMAVCDRFPAGRAVGDRWVACWLHEGGP